MSFINKRANANSIMSAKKAKAQSLVDMKIDVCAIPLAASKKITFEKQEMQSSAIQQIQTLGKDLFTPNKTIVSESDDKRLYQTADLYSESMSLEKLIPMLTSSDLTLRLNALRSGHLSSSTCMELTTGKLADLITKAQVDERNEKTCKVAIKGNEDKGVMFVGVKVRRGKHYIQKLDYEVPTAHDDAMHVKD